MTMDPLETDLHSHLVPGVDHGSRSPVETVTLARGLVARGFRRLHVTPHQYRFGNDFTVAELGEMADGVRLLLSRAGVDVEVVAGAEHYLGDRFLRALERNEELASFLFRGERCVLIELPLHQPVVGVRRVAVELVRRGLRPVMAHPERIESALADEHRRQRWLDAGWVFQLDLLSLAGHYGAGPLARAHEIVRGGAVFGLGSDLHRPSELEVLSTALAHYRDLTLEMVNS